MNLQTQGLLAGRRSGRASRTTGGRCGGACRVSPTRQRDERTDESKRGSGDHRVAITLRVGADSVRLASAPRTAAMRQQKAAAHGAQLAGRDATEQRDAERLAGGPHRAEEGAGRLS